MYEELIKRLRTCEDDCSKCPMMYDEQVEQDLVREHCAANEAADTIEKLALKLDKASFSDDKTSWIPVTEQLPEDGEYVLAYSEPDRLMFVAARHRFSEWEITHWMPPPEPPKEATE